MIRRFASLVRLSHTVFALPFALLAALLAWRDVPFRWQDLLGVVLAMFFARSAAMAFNRVVDRRFDAENPRTARREIPAGEVSASSAAIFTALCGAGFVASTALFLPNAWPLILAVPVLAWLLGYSYAKRFTSWCHYWLAAALMLSPPAAWIALTGSIATPPLWLAAAIFFWVGGFDVIYACQDIDFDRKTGLHSLPAKLGTGNALRLAAASHAITVGCLAMFWLSGGLGVVTLVALVAVAGLLVYEHTIVSPADLSRVGVAFFNINAVISLGLLFAGSVDVAFAAWTA
ncbi:MAG: UbiA-like polyprenyltransferase [Planctomycetota bacterium]